MHICHSYVTDMPRNDIMTKPHHVMVKPHHIMTKPHNDKTTPRNGETTPRNGQAEKFWKSKISNSVSDFYRSLLAYK